MVATGFARNRPGIWNTIFGLLSPFLITPQKGARTTLYLASSPQVDGQSGGYYAKCKEVTPTRAARDDEAARRLWDESEKLVARVLGQPQ